MHETVLLLLAMKGLRILATLLAAGICVGWAQGFWRAIRWRAEGEDAARAIIVTIAGAVLLFQAHWLYPGLSDVSRLKLWVIAQAALVVSLLSAIYYHRRHDDRFRIGRTIITHIAMFAVCVLFVVFAR